MEFPSAARDLSTELYLLRIRIAVASVEVLMEILSDNREEMRERDRRTGNHLGWARGPFTAQLARKLVSAPFVPWQDLPQARIPRQRTAAHGSVKCRPGILEGKMGGTDSLQLSVQGCRYLGDRAPQDDRRRMSRRIAVHQKVREHPRAVPDTVRGLQTIAGNQAMFLDGGFFGRGF